MKDGARACHRWRLILSGVKLGVTGGGDVTVTATDSVSIAGRSLTPVTDFNENTSSGLFSNADSTADLARPGGNIDLTAKTVSLADGATISAKSSGPGLAGKVTIEAGNQIERHDSFITTEAKQADGGNIDIQAGSLVHLSGSEITTSVGQGEGKGGNITIDPQFVVLNNSQIRADAFGGPGGNITIVTDVFLSSGRRGSAKGGRAAS